MASNLFFEHVVNLNASCQETGMLQDADGFLWISSLNGLLRWDGYNVKTYTTQNGLGSDALTYLLIDPDNPDVLWFGSHGGGLHRLDKATETVTIYLHDPDNPHSIPINSFVGITADDTDPDILWGVAYNYLIKFDKSTARAQTYAYTPAVSNSGWFFAKVLPDAAAPHILWLSSAGAGLVRFDKTTATFIQYVHDPADPHSFGLPSNSLREMNRDRDDPCVFWLSYYAAGETRPGGLGRFDTRTGQFTNYTDDYENPHSVAAYNYAAVHDDGAGHLWLAAWLGDGGVVFFDKATGQAVPHTPDPDDPHSVSTGAVIDILEDRSGILWFLNVSGDLDKLDPHRARFTLHQHNPKDANSLLVNGVERIQVDARGEVWLAQTAGLTRYTPQTGRYTRYAPTPDNPAGLPVNGFSQTFREPNGDLLVAPWSIKPLIRFDPDRNIVLKYYEDIVGVLDFAADPADANILWLALKGVGGLGKFDRRLDKLVALYATDLKHPEKGPICNDIYDILIDREEAVVWLVGVEADCGVSRFDKQTETFKHYQADPADPHTLSNNTCYALYQDRQGQVWVGTVNGLNRFDKVTETFTRYGEAAGIAGSVMAIEGDAAGKLWLSTGAAGLLEFNPQTGKVERRYDVGDGLQSNTFLVNIGAHTSDGQLWFGGVNGANSFYPAQLPRNTASQPVVLTSLTQGMVAVDWGRVPHKLEAITLAPQKNYFEFEYALLNFTRPDKSRYAYILEGFDPDWFNAGTLRYGRYTGLGEGLYTLKVKAANNDGFWSEQLAILHVCVLPDLPADLPVFSLAEMQTDETAQLTYQQNSFALEVRPLDFSLVGQSCEYLLEGYDQTWRPLGSHRYVFYQNVVEGNYTFKLRTGQTVLLNKALRITPPFTRSAPFYALVGVGIAGVLGGAYAFNINRLKTRQEITESRLAAEAATARAETATARAETATAVAAAQAEQAAALRTLNIIAQEVTGILDLQGLLRKVVALTKETFNYYHVHIFLRDGATRALVLTEGYGEAGREMKAQQYRIPLDHAASLTARAAREGQLFIVDDAQAEPGWQPHPLLPDVRAKIAAPIKREDQVVGVLTVYSDRPAGLGENDAELLQLLANQVAVAMTNAGLFDAVTQARAEAEQARGVAEQANQAKSEFLASMSHELRTPLNGILGYAQVLKRNRELTPLQRNGLNIIQQSGEHLLTLINDVLDLAKIEARKLDLYPEDFNLRDFLDGVAGIIRIRAQSKDIGFALEVGAGLPARIHADEKRLRQVLINLLNNAVKFTDKGEVTLRVEEVAGLAFAGSHRVRFSVQDTGVGIPAHQLGLIFEPFEQTEAGKRKAEGTGLGLAISRRIVQTMGSDLQVASEVGVGSTFWFEVVLPVAVVPEGAGAAEKAREIIGYEGPRLTVLMVDDKEHNRAILRNVLAPLGFAFVEAENGEQGVILAHQVHPDVIIMDIVMPRLDGFAATGQLRAQAAFRDAVIIASSASVFEADRQRVLAMGCDAFLPKPVVIADLLTLLEEHLHVQWVYEERAAETAAGVPGAALVAPPAADLQALHEIAVLGNMRQVRAWAEALREQEAGRYQVFADQVLTLAQTFQKKQILDLAAYYLKTGA